MGGRYTQRSWSLDWSTDCFSLKWAVLFVKSSGPEVSQPCSEARFDCPYGFFSWKLNVYVIISINHLRRWFVQSQRIQADCFWPVFLLVLHLHFQATMQLFLHLRGSLSVSVVASLLSSPCGSHNSRWWITELTCLIAFRSTRFCNDSCFKGKPHPLLVSNTVLHTENTH